MCDQRTPWADVHLEPESWENRYGACGLDERGFGYCSARPRVARPGLTQVEDNSGVCDPANPQIVDCTVERSPKNVG